ncbi:cell division protein CrgA [Kineococcus sp. SYSU DK003]|uniref:cell division protein CrgA n=1 Tax=Kineococcus sp. SYSU DK003 TaxID=3383124 RepID=UPI003D7CE68B
MARRKKSDETDVTSDAAGEVTGKVTGGRRGRRGGSGGAVADAEGAIKRKNTLTPRWWIFLMVAFMVVGLLWIVVFYLSSALLPVPGWENWNLVAGFALVLVGFAMTTRWR